MTTIQTDIGEISWLGDLADDPALTLPSGATLKMQQLISLTNGECLDWFADAESRLVTKSLGLFEKEYNPDQPRDDHGRWAGDGSSSTSGAVASALVERAKVVEPRLTATVQGLASAHGGTMVALDTRIKREGSVAEKINKDVQASKTGESPTQIGEKLYDVNRYTMTIPDSHYVHSAPAVIADMQSKGIDLNVKNFWANDNNPFKGINIQATDSTGTKFEVQLQTPTSFDIKVADLHPAYKAWGFSTDPVVREALQVQMHADAARIPDPTGVELIPEGKYPAH